MLNTKAVLNNFNEIRRVSNKSSGHHKHPEKHRTRMSNCENTVKKNKTDLQPKHALESIMINNDTKYHHINNDRLCHIKSF